MAGINSLLFLLTTLAPFQEPPEDATLPFDASYEWHRGSKPSEALGEPDEDKPCFRQSQIVGPFACPPREHYQRCGSSCPADCSDSPCPYNCCVEGCFCDDGFVRGPDGFCMSRDECPIQGFPQRGCQMDEEWSLCLSACKNRRNCTNLNKPIICDHKCVSGCVCKDGMVRGPEGSCVFPDQCLARLSGPEYQDRAQNTDSLQPDWTPEHFNSPKGHFFTCENENERYTLCRRSCEDDCDNFKDQNRICKYICLPLPGCQCKSGFVRGPDGNCIKPDQCPGQPNTCNEQEEYLECGTACPRNCTNYDTDDTCIGKCMPGCFCKDPLIRGPDGQCIKPEQCPARPPVDCRENEEFLECGTSCPRNCTNYDTDDSCIGKCSPGCFCKDPLIRSPDGQCIKPEQCPARSPEGCRENEEFLECGTACPRNCNYDPNYTCMGKCMPGCFCKDPLIRGPDGKCIHPEECPLRSSGPCGEGEEFLWCGTACPKNCANYDKKYPCFDLCVAGCFCKDPLVRGPNGRCIDTKECSRSPFKHYCRDNEEYSFTSSLCQDDCDNYQNPWRVCKYVMLPGCECKKGYIRGRDGACIKPEECPQSMQANPWVIDKFPSFCKINEGFSISNSICPDNCDNYQNASRACNLIKIPGCKCKEGYVRDKSNICIRIEQCVENRPEDCLEKEEFNECGSYCEADCRNTDKGKCEDKRCRKGCFCKAGLVRGANWECIPPVECPSKQIN